jgi:hypothetical protein
LALIVFGGCATAPYRYGGEYHTQRDAALKPGEAQIERGRPAPVVDAMGRIASLPAKIVMLDSRVNNHDVSSETEDQLHEYLAKNGLEKVKVRINEYDPRGEWQRLVENESIYGPVRYTIGPLYVAVYTLFPGRIWGGDSYSPFTNTIHLYSDVPTLAIYEGGLAKIQAEREYKGFSAIFGGGLSRNIRASNDALSYIQENGEAAELKEAYRTLYPMVATSAALPLAHLVAPVALLPAWAGGHLAGGVKAAGVHDRQVAENQGRKEEASQPGAIAGSAVAGSAKRSFGEGRSEAGASERGVVAADASPGVVPASFQGSLQGDGENSPTERSPEVIRLPPVGQD